MDENKKDTKDWASELINHLLEVMQNAEIEGCTVDGVSCQRFSQKSFNLTFSFKSK